MRDDAWLFSRLQLLLRRYFSDVSFPNPLVIQFGRRAKTRLGSIRRMRGGESHILVNGHFKDTTVPEYVIDAVVGHELTHYVHGFQSGHPQRYEHPHAGGVVVKELTERGMGQIAKQHKQWIDTEWIHFLEKHHPTPTRRRASRRRGRYLVLRWL